MLKTLVVMSMVCLPLAAQEAQTNLLRVYGVGGLMPRAPRATGREIQRQAADAPSVKTAGPKPGSVQATLPWPVCPECGGTNPSGSAFCGECGTVLILTGA